MWLWPPCWFVRFRRGGTLRRFAGRSTSTTCLSTTCLPDSDGLPGGLGRVVRGAGRPLFEPRALCFEDELPGTETRVSRAYIPRIAHSGTMSASRRKSIHFYLGSAPHNTLRHCPAQGRRRGAFPRQETSKALGNVGSVPSGGDAAFGSSEREHVERPDQKYPAMIQTVKTT
ncbi:hypothetical protein HMPREF0972_01121 [Actinomyces sp. oral taxon 848 str. F0332]|nr:hypothetical protein HMPREF0972_01121 [Actinomyces sp. oral taxon 848 str. F0332]